MHNENHDFLSSQIITYIGNKRALLSFIESALLQVKADLGRDKLSIADMFSGSGIVSRFFKAHANRLISNDLEGYAHTLARCYLSNSAERDLHDLRQIHVELLREISGNLYTGFITRLYSPECMDNIKPHERAFYTPRNAMYIDTARNAIERLPADIRHFFIAPLLTEASVKTNTSGVFKGFYKNSLTGAGQFGGNGKNALSRILSDIELPFPVFSSFDCAVDATQLDASALARELEPIDLAYLDPPYNQHPYGSNYFMLNLINQYREPLNISRVSGIPRGWNRSDYNKSSHALASLTELCRSLPAKYLLISFNSEGFISKDDMESMLGAFGHVQTFRQRYNAFRASRNLRAREIYTSEYLFLVKKQDTSSPS